MTDIVIHILIKVIFHVNILIRFNGKQGLNPSRARHCDQFVSKDTAVSQNTLKLTIFMDFADRVKTPEPYYRSTVSFPGQKEGLYET